MKTQNTFFFNGGDNQPCIFVVESNGNLNSTDILRLKWILNPTVTSEHAVMLNPSVLTERTSTVGGTYNFFVGPNLRFETPESEKLRKICISFGLKNILRIEQFTAYSCTDGESPPYDRMTESVYTALPKTLIPLFHVEKTFDVDLIHGGIDMFKEVNKQYGMGMDEFDMNYYYNLFVSDYKRNPTIVELMQVAQGNSSHCRHWEFGGRFIIGGEEMKETLFHMVKQTLKKNPHGSVKAFKDNGGILKGSMVEMFLPGSDGVYRLVQIPMNHTATAETHNHPTLISPYPGAATGVGGRLRDIAAIGCGSLIGFGGVYFQTGKLRIHGAPLWSYPKNMATPTEVLVGSIKGASGYGNPFGEPTLLFGNDSLGVILPGGQRFESIKPIIYTCAVGSIRALAKDKMDAIPGMMIVRIGGATRRIGVGGGAASSMNTGDNKSDLDFASVQRGEPLMGRSAYNVIEYCVYMGDKNPIEAVHDQGAGGASNVITELTNPSGGSIDLAKMQIGDSSLSQTEIWIAEAQELYGILIKNENLELFKDICKKFECPIEILGETNDSAKIVVSDSRDRSTPVSLTLPEILGSLPQKTYTDTLIEFTFQPFVISDLCIDEHFKKVAQIPGVALLGYMTDHFDGSVGGRVVQGPRSGEYQLPICPYAIMSDGFTGTTGVVSTIARSNPVAMLIDEKATARMTVAHMLATLSFVEIPGGIEMMKGRLNVMWPFKQPGMKARLYSAYSAITDALADVGFGIDGGKDSSSLSVNFDGNAVMSFPTFILEPYVHLDNFRSRITPELKGGEGSTDLILIELEENRGRMGGSALCEAHGETGNEVPDANPKKAKALFELVQRLVKDNMILAGSPKIKGGLLPTIAKMSIASQVEAHVQNPTETEYASFYFNEEIGVIVQCRRTQNEEIIQMAQDTGLKASIIGSVKSSSKYFTFYGKDTKYSPFASDVREWFRETGKQIKKQLGMPHKLLSRELHFRQNCKLTFNPDEDQKIPTDKKFKVAVLAAPGTNGHHELAFMFGRMEQQFSVSVIQMNELIKGAYDLKDFNVIAFAGGFSYGDVGGSGKGWAASILFNEKLKKMFDDFYARPDTLSFGVCNGFQVATLLGVLDESLGQKPRLLHNDSGIFEHRPVNLLIPENTTSIMFSGMEGSILPAWSAHGEGKLFLPDYDSEWIESLGLVAVQYADSNGRKTDDYPFNPNGSPNAIAGLCTENGRHTFMMPHIERVSASNDHLPYKPKDWNFTTPVWAKAFVNMYLWLYQDVESQ